MLVLLVSLVGVFGQDAIVPVAEELHYRVELGMDPMAALCAATCTNAALLGRDYDLGTLEKGKRADVQVLDCTDPRELAYEFAGAGPRLVLSGGRVVCQR